MSVAPIEPSLVNGGCIVNSETREAVSLVLATLTLVISLVNAIGVLLVNGKVDRLNGRVDALQTVITGDINADARP